MGAPQWRGNAGPRRQPEDKSPEKGSDPIDEKSGSFDCCYSYGWSRRGLAGRGAGAASPRLASLATTYPHGANRHAAAVHNTFALGNLFVYLFNSPRGRGYGQQQKKIFNVQAAVGVKAHDRCGTALIMGR